MNFSGLNALGPAGGAKLLSENELMVIIKLLDTLPPGATLQSVITTNTTHPVVPILLALNPNQLQQIQQYMAARMRQLSQQFLQPQILQQVQMQQNVQPKQSVLVPPKPNVWHNSYLPDWICGANNCRVMNVGWRAACCECGAVKPGTGDNFMPRLGYHHNAQHTFNNNNAYDPHNNQQPYQQPPEFNGHDYSNQEPLPSYDNTQPSDDYPLEPLGVDVDAPVEEDPNDTEVETFDNATSSIISPVKQRPPPRVVSARANALIPPSIPAQNHQPSYHHEPSPPPMEQSSSYYDGNQYSSLIERPPISPVLADQEQSNEYDYGSAHQEENYNHEEHRKHRRDADEPLVMSDRTIYVKNIVPVEEEDLERIFRSAGGIRNIRMKRDNRPTTSAFIEYWNKEDAKVAYETLHGVTLAGKRLQVGWAVARFSGKPLNKPSKSLFLGNLPNEMTENMIRQLVLPHGNVLHIKKVHQFGEFRGCAFVDFARVEDAQKALYAVHRTFHMGKRIRADYSNSQERSDNIPGLDLHPDLDPGTTSRSSRDSNKDPRDEYKSHRDDTSSKYRQDNKSTNPEARVDRSGSDQPRNTTPTKPSENQPSISYGSTKSSEQRKSDNDPSPNKPAMVISPPKPAKGKKYWKPTRNLEHYIEAIRVSKSSSGLMSTVIEKRGVCYKGLNGKGEFADIKLYLEGPKRKVDEFFNFVASYKTSGTVDKDVVYPVFIISRGHAEIAHLNWESPYVLGPRSQILSFSGVSFKKGSVNYPSTSKQAPNTVVTVVVDPSEAKTYRKVMPNLLLLILPESNRPLSYARHVVKRMAEGANCDGISIELPFYWLCDDNLVQFSKLEPEQGQTVKQHKTGDEMFKEALLHAQSREDINDYGLVGFLRYDDAAVSKTTEEAKNKVSIYKCVLVNVNKTRGSNYIPGLKKFEEVAYAMRLKKDSVPTLKLFNYCFRAVTLQTDYSLAKERSDFTKVEEPKDTSISVDDLLEEGYEPRTAAELENISALKEWIVKQESKGKFLAVVKPRPKPFPQLDSSNQKSTDTTPADSPVKPARRSNKAFLAQTQPKNSDASAKPQNTTEGVTSSPVPESPVQPEDTSSDVSVNNDQPQEGDNEESSIIGKEFLLPEIDPEELDKPAKKRQLIDESISSSYDSDSDSDSESNSDSDDVSEEQPGTARIKSKNEQQKKKDQPADMKKGAPVAVPKPISEVVKTRRDAAKSASSKVAAPSTPPQKKKTPLKGAAVKAPGSPKEKKQPKKKQETTDETAEEVKTPINRGKKRKVDEVSQTSESDNNGAVNDEPQRKRARNGPLVGSDGRRHFCHQCRQPRSQGEVVYCTAKEDCRWTRGWCGVCLRNRYGLNIDELRKKEWMCPMCQGHCNCSTCRVFSGKNPTGAITIDALRRLGFQSVHDYLTSKGDEKVITGTKAAKKKSKAKKAKLSGLSDSVEPVELTVNNTNNTNKTEVPVAKEKEDTTPLATITNNASTSPAKEVSNTNAVPAAPAKKAPAHRIERDIEPLVIDDEGEEYSVDKIYLKRKNVNTQLVQFLVKWHGFPLTVSTWVNLADMFCGDMLHEFEVEWNTKREKIEAAAKKKLTMKSLSVTSDIPDVVSHTANNTNTPALESSVTEVTALAASTNTVALDKNVKLTQTQDEIPMSTLEAGAPHAQPQRAPLETAVPMDTTTTESGPSTAVEQATESEQRPMEVESEMTTEMAAQQVEQSNQFDSPSEVMQSVMAATNMSPEEAPMLHEVAAQVFNEAMGQVPSEVTMTVDNELQTAIEGVLETSPEQQQLDVDQAQSEANVTVEEKKLMDTIEQLVAGNDEQQQMQTDTNQQSSVEENIQTSTVQSNTEGHQPMDTERAISEELMPNVNNEPVPQSAAEGAVAESSEMPSEAPSLNATSPSQLKNSMSELSQARSERIKRSPTADTSTGNTTSPASSKVTPVTPTNSAPRESVPALATPPRASTNAKAVTPKAVTPVKLVKLDPGEVTGETDPNEFDVGMKVWVKLPGYKWWPGQIVSKTSDNTFLVTFYSAESFKEVTVSDPDTKMVLFEAYLDILGPLTSRKALNEALVQQHDWHPYSEDPKKKKTKRRKKKY